MQSQPITIPYGFCHCGCGQRTKIAPQSDPRCGDIYGEPRRFLQYHNLRRANQHAVTDPVSGCWIWQGYLSNGYARVAVDGRKQLLYRVIYEAIHGPLPFGLQLDHLCRNRACINPDHLEPVTQTVNLRRGKQTRLTEAQAAEIRSLAKHMTYKQIAPLYGVALTTISAIVLGKTWKLHGKGATGTKSGGR